MIVFDFFVNLVEAITFSYFLTNQFKLKFKKSFICISSLIQMLFLTYANLINNEGLYLSIAIIISLILCLVLWTKKIEFNYMYVVLIYNSIIIISTIISIFFVHGMGLNDLLAHIVRCTISKLIQIIITFIIIKFKINFSTTFEFKEWSYVIFFNFLLLMMLVVSAYSFVLGNTSLSIVEFFVFSSFIEIIIFHLIIMKVNEFNKRKIEYAKINEINKLNTEKLFMIKKISEEHVKTEHQIYYILLQMEGYLDLKQYDKLNILLKKYRGMVSKNKTIVDTKNALFDILYSAKINNLILRGKSVENSIFISQRSFYNNIRFIDMITGMIDYFDHCNKLIISMTEIGQFLSCKIVYREGTIDEKELINYFSKCEIPVENYNLDNHIIKGVRFMVDLEETDEN